MSTIDQLPTITTLQASDKIAIYSSENGDARKASMTALRDFFQGNMTAAFAVSITASSYSKTTAVLVANLPSAAIVGAGARSAVTNATQTLTAGIGAAVVGGGANIVPVFSDGTSWRIG